MTDWRTSGACYATFNPDFFAAPGGRRDTARARAICQTCPVTAECLDYAQSTHQYYGIWAGTTLNQRRKLARKAA